MNPVLWWVLFAIKYFALFQAMCFFQLILILFGMSCGGKVNSYKVSFGDRFFAFWVVIFIVLSNFV